MQITKQNSRFILGYVQYGPHKKRDLFQERKESLLSMRCMFLGYIFESRPNIVQKWWRHKNEICEIMGFVKIFWKNNVRDAYSPKISNSGQIVSELLAQLCCDDSIQIILNLAWFVRLRTRWDLEGFVWSHRSITGLISQSQSAPNC